MAGARAELARLEQQLAQESDQRVRAALERQREVLLEAEFARRSPELAQLLRNSARRAASRTLVPPAARSTAAGAGAGASIAPLWPATVDDDRGAPAHDL